ncbi:hypothetical protein ABPG74_013342 [Tetrahymena malaccensis]
MNFNNNNNNNAGYNANQDIENFQMMGFAAAKNQQMMNQQYDQQQHNKKGIAPHNNQSADQISNNEGIALTGLSDVSLRRSFIRKVLGIICAQLIITFAFIIPSTLSDDYRDFQKKYIFIAYLSLILNIATMITLYCFRKQCMKVPNNYILLFIFTITEGYLISMITAVSQPEVVLLAGGITFGIVLFITIYACTTKNDITQKVTAIFYVSMALLVIILVASLFRSYIIQTLIGLAIVGVFCFYLVFDIQRLQGNKYLSYSYDDYIIASLDIYIDIVVIFQTILGLANRE